MKSCPNCKNVSVVSAELIVFWVLCPKCGMTGPKAVNLDNAVAAWNALPRRAEPPEFRGSTYEIDGITYNVSFSYNGPVITAMIIWKNKKGRFTGTCGVSICHPDDEYDRNIGERVAMRKACGIDNLWSPYRLRALYDAWRKEQHDSMLPPANGVF